MYIYLYIIHIILLFQNHLVPFYIGNTPFFNVLCEMNHSFQNVKDEHLPGPEELERMEREEEERRNAEKAERRLERQGHGTSLSLTWDGMVGLLIAMLDLHPTIYKP